MSISFAKLGDIADVNWGNTSITKASYREKGFPAFSASGCDGYLPTFDHNGDGVILSAIGAKCGKCFPASGKWTAIKNTITITPHKSDHANFRFLFYYLNREELWPRRGVGQPFIGLGDARQVLVPFPSLTEQRRIAAILDKADELRAKRRASLHQIEDLAEATFFDLFDDPRQNRTGWPIVPLGELCLKLVDGCHKTPTYVQSGVPFITVSNIVSGTLDFAQTKFISPNEHATLTKRVKPGCGDILVSKDGTIGVPCPVETDREFSIFVSVALLKIKHEIVDQIFLTKQLQTDWIQSQIRAGTKGIAIRHLHLNDFKRLSILVPPLPLQKEFVRRIAAVERLKAAHRATLSEMDALFASLQYRAFRGEL